MQATIPQESCTMQAGSDPPRMRMVPAVFKGQGSSVQHVKDSSGHSRCTCVMHALMRACGWRQVQTAEPLLLPEV